MSTSPLTTEAIGGTVPSSAPAPTRRVVDAPTRMFHWLFALTFAGAYATAESEHARLLHVTLGYAFGGLLGFRLLYGLIGPRHARLGLLWGRVANTMGWLRSLAAARPWASTKGRQGQNLAVAWTILAMIALVAPLVLSGYGAYHDWGDALGGDWLEELHEFFGQALLAAVMVHLGLVAGLSLLRRRNQALPMLTGRVPGRGPDAVPHNRGWLAALLLGAVLAFGAWQWFDSPHGLLPSRDSAELAAPKHGPGRERRHHSDD